MKAKKPNPKTVAKQVHKLVEKIKHNSQPVFSVMPAAGGGMDVVRLTMSVMKRFKKTGNEIAKIRARLEKACSSFVLAMFPTGESRVPFDLAISRMRCELRRKRAQYLERGKPIPGMPGNVGYQNKAITALLIILEPAPFGAPSDKVRTRRPAKARHNKLRRR